MHAPKTNLASSAFPAMRQTSWILATKLFPICFTALSAIIALCSKTMAANVNTNSEFQVLCTQGIMVTTESLSLSNVTISCTNTFSAWVQRKPYAFRIEVLKQPAGNPIYSISENHTWSLSNAVVCFDFKNTNYSPAAYQEFLLSHFQLSNRKTASPPATSRPSSTPFAATSNNAAKPKKLSDSGMGQIIPGSIPVGSDTFSDLVWLAFCSGGYFATNSESRCPPIGDRIERDEPGPWFRGEPILTMPEEFSWFPHEVKFRSTGMFYFRGPPPIGIQPIRDLPNGKSKWKAYAPPFDKGFLRATYRVKKHTNQANIEVPLEFEFKSFLPDYPNQDIRQRYVVTGRVTNCFGMTKIPNQETATEAPIESVFLDFRVPVDIRGQPTRLKLAAGEKIPEATAVVASKEHFWQKARIQRLETEITQDRKTFIPLLVFAFISISVFTFIYATTKNKNIRETK